LLTYKDIPKQSPDLLNTLQIEKDLIILGVVGIKDPLRPEIVSAVQRCKEASVTVRMVTGDVKETAVAIAKNARILDEDYIPGSNPYEVLTGKEFRELVNKQGDFLQSREI